MDGLDATRGAWAFIAGVTFNKENPTKIAGNDTWPARRDADGFKQFWHSGYYRLCRLRYPDELLKDTVLEEQGRALGAWVVTTLRMLADDPPDS